MGVGGGVREGSEKQRAGPEKVGEMKGNKAPFCMRPWQTLPEECRSFPCASISEVTLFSLSSFILPLNLSLSVSSGFSHDLCFYYFLQL